MLLVRAHVLLLPISGSSRGRKRANSKAQSDMKSEAHGQNALPINTVYNDKTQSHVI